ncbi:hypothetical protein C8R47DRAFT_1066094 [Mycena vitilis]|nr:hypothetical protein C8R47DRAFT_1066094 [Mycena vitilis]
MLYEESHPPPPFSSCTDSSGQTRRLPSATEVDFCIFRRIVRVGEQGTQTGLNFWRHTCLEFTPQSSGVAVRPLFDETRLADRYIMPPLDHDAAVRAMSWMLSGDQPTTTTITVGRGLTGTSFLSGDVLCQEAYIDLNIHRDCLFCAAFLKNVGEYEIAQLLSVDGRGAITMSTLIFAPSAWKHAARVLSYCGRVAENKDRLLCRLQSGEIFALDVRSEYVNL